ncbi:MAG: dephospho-CoA kinase [Acidimicrobiia bacterium]
MSEVQPNWLLCGGIGSGKSVVRKLFEVHGLSTIDADSVGHEVIQTGGAGVAAVSKAWPEVVVGGEIDRKELGAIVFADPAALAKLEGITHPHIFALIEERLSSLALPVVVEIPLLVQPFSGSWRRIVVDTTDDLRLERAVARGLEEKEALRRMASQPSRQQWLAAADLVVPNSGSIEDLEEATAGIVEVVRGSIGG